MNTLLIYVDDMRADCVRYMPFVSGTLAPLGTTFSHAYQPVPICQAARIGFLTGQYPHGANNGVYQNDDGIGQADTESIAFYLQNEGVETGFIGKAANTYRPEEDPLNLGTYIPNRTEWDTWRPIVEQEQDAFTYTIVNGITPANPNPPVHDLTHTASLVSNFMLGATEPWFCFWSPTQPHIQLTSFASNSPLPASQSKFEWKWWDLDLLTDTTGKPTWIQNEDGITNAQKTSMRTFIRQQLREIYDLDQAIAGLYADLDGANLLADTRIIFTSDNGVFYGEHRSVNAATAGKDSPYEAAARVPLIIVGPGIPEGETNTTAVAVPQDVHATLLDTHSATGNNPDGASLISLIASGNNTARGVLYARQGNQAPTEWPDGNGLITTRRKLLRWTEATGNPAADFTANPNDEYELYDLENDPGELTNLAYEPEWADERDALEAQMDALLA